VGEEYFLGKANIAMLPACGEKLSARRKGRGEKEPGRRRFQHNAHLDQFTPAALASSRRGKGEGKKERKREGRLVLGFSRSGPRCLLFQEKKEGAAASLLEREASSRVTFCSAERFHSGGRTQKE